MDTQALLSRLSSLGADGAEVDGAAGGGSPDVAVSHLSPPISLPVRGVKSLLPLAPRRARRPHFP